MIETFKQKLTKSKEENPDFKEQCELTNQTDYQELKPEELQKKIVAIDKVNIQLNEMLTYYRKEQDKIMNNEAVNCDKPFNMQDLRPIYQPTAEEREKLQCIREEKQKVAKQIDRLNKRKETMESKLSKEEQEELTPAIPNENDNDSLKIELDLLKQVSEEDVRVAMNRHCRQQILNRMLKLRSTSPSKRNVK